jgi:hypothetical protein
VYKPGFWSQGPGMLEALNILEGYDIQGLTLNSADYIHTLVEALKLAYADRDTYYGDPKFNKIPTDMLLSKAYAAERRKLITEQASLEFRPGKIGDKPMQHPFFAEIQRYKIPDALMAKDTTCVDAIDKDGMAFSATPSGAWMPTYLVGDTRLTDSFGGKSSPTRGAIKLIRINPSVAIGFAGNVQACESIIERLLAERDRPYQDLVELLFSTAATALDTEFVIASSEPNEA